MVTKICTKCGKEFPATLEFFSPHSLGKFGLKPACRICCRKWQEDNREEINARARARYDPTKRRKELLKYNYGLSSEEYNKMFDEQGGVCAICGKPEKTTIRNKQVSLCIDHNHETGKIRGLLCINCNKGLGHFMDDTNLMQKAIRYLDEH